MPSDRRTTITIPEIVQSYTLQSGGTRVRFQPPLPMQRITNHLPRYRRLDVPRATRACWARFRDIARSTERPYDSRIVDDRPVRPGSECKISKSPGIFGPLVYQIEDMPTAVTLRWVGLAVVGADDEANERHGHIDNDFRHDSPPCYVSCQWNIPVAKIDICQGGTPMLIKTCLHGSLQSEEAEGTP